MPREIFTTGAVAKVLHVAPRTVSKMFDRGLISGYRIPGSQDRRITRTQLRAFMRTHEIPEELLDNYDRQAEKKKTPAGGERG